MQQVDGAGGRRSGWVIGAGARRRRGVGQAGGGGRPHQGPVLLPGGGGGGGPGALPLPAGRQRQAAGAAGGGGGPPAHRSQAQQRRHLLHWWELPRRKLRFPSMAPAAAHSTNKICRRYIHALSAGQSSFLSGSRQSAEKLSRHGVHAKPNVDSGPGRTRGYQARSRERRLRFCCSSWQYLWAPADWRRL